jgi:hypothetical protein
VKSDSVPQLLLTSGSQLWESALCRGPGNQYSPDVTPIKPIWNKKGYHRNVNWKVMREFSHVTVCGENPSWREEGNYLTNIHPDSLICLLWFLLGDLWFLVVLARKIQPGRNQSFYLEARKLLACSGVMWSFRIKNILTGKKHLWQSQNPQAAVFLLRWLTCYTAVRPFLCNSSVFFLSWLWRMK